MPVYYKKNILFYFFLTLTFIYIRDSYILKIYIINKGGISYENQH